MEPTLRLREAAPAAGALVFAQQHGPRAGPAADAGIALIVERVIRNLVLRDKAPHVLLGPVGERADFDEAEFLVPADDGRGGPIGALIAADRAGPGVHADDSLFEHLHFAIEAALIGIG